MFDQLITSMFSAEQGLACATCMGDSGSAVNQAAGYAITFMLLMLCVVLGSLIKFMSYLSKKEKGEIPVPVPARARTNSDHSN